MDLVLFYDDRGAIVSSKTLNPGWYNKDELKMDCLALGYKGYYIVNVISLFEVEETK